MGLRFRVEGLGPFRVEVFGLRVSGESVEGLGRCTSATFTARTGEMRLKNQNVTSEHIPQNRTL